MTRLSILGIAGAVSAAWGQCQQGWSDEFAPAFFTGSYEPAATVFDDGSGPKLVVTGLTRPGESEPGLQVWDGQSWSNAGLPPGAASNEGIVRAFNDHVPPRLVFEEIDSNRSMVEVYLLENGEWRALGFPTGSFPQFVAGASQGLDPAADDLFVFGLFSGSSTTLVFHWDGQAWTATDVAGSGVHASVTSLEWFDDGAGPKLYAGLLDQIGGVQAAGVARWDGQAWEEVGAGCPAYWPYIAVHDDGTGPALWALDSNGAMLASWNGASWTSHPLAPDRVRFAWRPISLEIGGHRELYWDAGQISGSRLWRWDGAEGQIVSETTTGGIWDLCDDPSGALGAGLFAVGNFLDVGGDPAARVARWDGSGWHPLANEDVGNGTINPKTVMALGESAGPLLGSRVYVGADVAAGAVTHGVASWDGRQWAAIGPPEMTTVHTNALAFGDLGAGPRLFAGGSIKPEKDSTNSIIAWDGQNWSVVGEGLDYSTVSDLAVGRIAQGESTLFVAGDFTQVNGESNDGVVGLTESGWVSLAGGLPSTTGQSSISAVAVHDDGSGAALYVGAPSKPVDTNFTNSVVRWDGESWSPVGEPLAPQDRTFQLRDLLSADLGNGRKLYAAGRFQSLDGSIKNVAVWDGSAWAPLGQVPIAVGRLAALQTPDGPRLAATESFTFPIGEPAERVWVWDGESWSAFGAVAESRVTGIAQADHEEGAVYLVGSFEEVAGVPSEGIARWGCVGCVGDFNGDGVVDTRDFIAFLNAWASQDSSADIDGNGVIDTRDVVGYLNLWTAGC
ncbi:MAG: hypothetical protein IPJ41_03680 [Phycisphaerales bacterium]|nr:hypothetical protein [Phycisphaerales bacterium]